MTGAEEAALSDSVRGSLATLKDVSGITGSFVCANNGRLVAREIPAVFEDGVLAEAGSRLLRLGETFAAGGDDLDVAVVRFRDHRLYLKSVTGGMLCVLADGDVNMPALRMAANLVSRRIAPAVARVQAELAPGRSVVGATAVVATPAIAESAAGTSRPGTVGVAPGVAPPGMRRFRGQKITQ